MANRAAEGADYIKVIIDLPGFDQHSGDTGGVLGVVALSAG